MRDELNEYVLAFVLTAVLVWYTYVSPSYAPARAPRRVLPDERASGGGGEELDWPEYLEEV
ncbi:MAG TPA: hypothetical protein VGX48_16070 [Pyrinomonadaceae bacterium]|jgi:hypothetical protein|nr:hypothetical protein [Pyrinomonadaceae bacterium]